MSVQRQKRYLMRWRRYQHHSDLLTRGSRMWFMGVEYPGYSLAEWAYKRTMLVRRFEDCRGDQLTQARGWRGR